MDDPGSGTASEAGGATGAASLLDAVPVQSWEVRRRRYGEGHWLVRHNEVFEIDALTDAAWRACGDGRRAIEIVRIVAEELALPPADALEPTLAALVTLSDAGLVRFEQPG